MSADPSESSLWQGRPSQWTNLPRIIAASLLAAAVAAAAWFWQLPWLAAGILLPAGWAAAAILRVRCVLYELSDQRLRFSRGVFNRSVDELELYRIKDSSVFQPLLLRIVGCGHVLLETSDRSEAQVRLTAVHDPLAVREHLRHAVERVRDAKRVREVDFDPL